MSRKFLPACLLVLGGSFSAALAAAPAVAPKLSEESGACLDCHRTVTPGIVEDWRASLHAKTTLESALKKPRLERRVSIETAPDKLKSVAIGCYECHGQNAAAHQDDFDHFGTRIHVVVTPNDCKTCHPVEATEYAGSKKANAFGNLRKNPLYHTLVETVTSMKEVKNGKLAHLPASNSAKAQTCYACHGTEVKVLGMKTVETEMGDIEVPNLSGWPNMGVGRVNPDGSLGSCSACHPRHSFAIEIARKPYTCSQCHLQPDVPAWDVYIESKHGNIFQSKQQEWNWNHVPWRVGQDFKAPTCATCHNALLVNSDGDVVAPRSHDFAARLWVRIFGLIYSHPQPRSGATHVIKNKDGLPLPTAFTGEAATEFLINPAEQDKRQAAMRKVCVSCHSTDWANGHFARMRDELAGADKMVRSATELLAQAWDLGLADKANPFDEEIEQEWVEQWLFFANSVRYAAAMGGPDYAAFKNGWWELTRNLQRMHERIEAAKKAKKKK